MKRLAAVAIATLVFVSLSLIAGEPEYLIRVDRRASTDRGLLLDNDIAVVMELAPCLLIQGDRGDIAKLESEGYEATVLDSAPTKWDYYQVGLRPDSDRVALGDVGTVIHTEENWVILRVTPGTNLDRLYDAKVFVAKVPRERISKPSLELPGKGAAFNRPPGPDHVVPLVQQMVNSVVNTDIMNYWTGVVPPNPPGTGTRYSTSTGCTTAAANIYNIYDGLGLSPQYQNYMSGYAPNTIGTITGAVNPGKVYILIGHLDDMPSSGYAPGADDNASGVVAGLEVAKIMSCYAFKNTVKFIACTGEEEGLYGSGAYAADAQSRGENIQGVIAFDMPGWEGDGTPVPENLDLNYNASIPGSQALGQLFAACATDYGTGLVVDAFDCPSLDASDHYPFWQKGWAAVCGITDNEGYCGHNGTYPVYHTSNDTIAACGNPAFFYSGVRGTLATLAELGEPFKIILDRASYGCSVPVTIIVGDKDLDTNPTTTQTVTIQIWSTREGTPENVVLTEQGVNSMIFKGAINLTGSAPAHGDGLLSVNPGDAITAEYIDAVDCNGATDVTYDAAGTVSTDCTGPVITNVLVTNISDTTAAVTWTTDEAANSRAIYGASKPPGSIKDDLGTYVTTHSMTLTGLSACTPYYFSVYSEDAVGNPTTNDNSGAYFAFTTYGRSYVFGPDQVESGTNGWTATGTAGSVWHIDTCRADSATHAWKAGASDAPTCTAPYGNSVTTDLTSGTLVLGAAGHGLHLRWNEWYATESGYDYCQPQISTDGGTSWADLVTHYSGASSGWGARDISLASYSGSVMIRFHFTSDTSQNGEGWYVDDIDVSKSQSCTAQVAYQSNTWTDSCTGTGTGVGNGYLDPGEDIAIHPTLKNIGSQTAAGISATLSTMTPGITVTGATATYPDLVAGASAACNAPHFAFSVGTDVTCGTVINFNLHVTATTGGGPWDEPFTMMVGHVVPGGATPLSENWDSVTPPAFPAGWATAQVSGTAGVWATHAGTRYPSGVASHSTPNLAYFNSFTSSSGSQTRLYRTSGVAIPAAATSATLTFWMYHDTGYTGNNDRVQAQVSTNGGSSWTNVGTAVSRYDGSTGWKVANVDLTSYAGQADVRISF
jgi:hypothetical protein